jgi:hypothetical protein
MLVLFQTADVLKLSRFKSKRPLHIVGVLFLKPFFMDDKKKENIEDLPTKINLLNEFHAHVINPESIPGGEITEISNDNQIKDLI